jgi:hypothetical protein
MTPNAAKWVADRRKIDYIPTRKFRVRVDADKVIENGTVAPN